MLLKTSLQITSFNITFRFTIYELVGLLYFTGNWNMKIVCFSDAQSSGLIQFIVDSGSEVGVTVTSQFIKDLQLEYLHNIESRGVHATRDRPVYRGVLKLGSEEFDVEVS